MKPLISFIVPVFNNEATIRNCVDSILNQVDCTVELILVDDGSKDSSYDICKTFVDLNPNVKLIHQENHGVSAARNIGIDHATGKYISFVDADDFLPSDFVKQMLDQAGTDADMIACTCFAVIDGEQVPQHFFPTTFNAEYDQRRKQDIFHQLMDTSYMQMEPVYTGIGVPWGKLIKASVIKENDLRFDVSLDHYEDNLFILSLYYLTDKIVFLNQCLYYYSTSHITSVLSKYDEKIVKSYLSLYRLRNELIRNNMNKTNEEMLRHFKLASLNLFDIAVFSMIINQKKDSVLHKCITVKNCVEHTGYLSFFRTDLDGLQLTAKRKTLYCMLSHKLYFPVVAALLIRHM